MKTALDKIREEIAELSVEDRAVLVDELIVSLHEEKHDRFDTDPEFQQEIKRRIEDLESGKVQGIPAENVLAELKAKYNWK